MNGNIVYSKPQNTVTARAMRLDFARKHMKDPAQICKKKYNILYDGNQFGRRREAAHDMKHVENGGGSIMAWECMAANGSG